MYIFGKKYKYSILSFMLLTFIFIYSLKVKNVKIVQLLFEVSFTRTMWQGFYFCSVMFSKVGIETSLLFLVAARSCFKSTL